ncbi:hypothetical protein [Streptomyces sp. NRRL S-1448]|uniref:hypothetical protein n=1 Tax=Streptomyces sp. NRRL S-1448 TaxID=1463883 RepID=UPI0006902366|nr:hypothetical protein [Streptomyces sp. NRRL S-1448]
MRARRSEEEVLSVAGHRHPTAWDHVALVEIDLTGELMIAAATASEDRLSPDRIDEVLDVESDGDGDRGGGEPSGAAGRG